MSFVLTFCTVDTIRARIILFAPHTSGSEEALSGNGASIFTLGMEKNNYSCNFVDFQS